MLSNSHQISSIWFRGNRRWSKWKYGHWHEYSQRYIHRDCRRFLRTWRWYDAEWTHLDQHRYAWPSWAFFDTGWTHPNRHRYARPYEAAAVSHYIYIYFCKTIEWSFTISRDWHFFKPTHGEHHRPCNRLLQWRPFISWSLTSAFWYP